jgi:hypothetical protein
VPESNLEAEVVAKRDLQHLEDSLQRLWEKAHIVSETIIRLKEENKELLSRVASLVADEGRLSTSLLEREKELSSLRQQLVEIQSSGGGLFDAQEREEMKGRLKELISMINSRL